MSYGLAGGVVIAILSLPLGGCGDRRPVTPSANTEEAKAVPLTPADRAKLDECLAEIVRPPWRLLRTQSFTENVSVTIEASSSELGLPHRANDYRYQQFVELGVGAKSLITVPSPERRRAEIARGWLQPVTRVAGIAAADFVPFVPYERAGLVTFLNNPGYEYCMYRPEDAAFPNPFVRCWAKRNEYTAVFTFPHDAIAHLPRLSVDARALIGGITSCFDLLQ